MNTARSSSRSPSNSRPGTANWVPPGIRPLTAPNQHTTPLTGTRRNRAVERTHYFLECKDLSARDPMNYFWLYGAYEYRLQTPHEEAKIACFKMIDRLIERIKAAYHEAPAFLGAPESGGSGMTSMNNLQASRLPGGGGGEPTFRGRATSAGGLSDVSRSTNNNNGTSSGSSSSSAEPKAHLIIDIISTKKHISPVPDEGLPYRLGHDIYRYVEATYGSIVATTFVGLTDNTARRVGRDVYYTRSDDLSRTHYGFHTVDREHLFIVFPPQDFDSASGASGPSGGGGGEPNDGRNTTARGGKGKHEGGGGGGGLRDGYEGGDM